MKGEHSKGSLIHDNVSNILIVGNLYAHNYERSPLFKGGVRGMVINNLIYNPGPRAVHYNLIAEEWAGHEYQLGQLALIGNAMRAGPSTPTDVALFMLGGSGDIAREDIISARRNVIYAARTFEQRRRELLVDVASDYINLIEQQAVIANQERSLEFAQRLAAREACTTGARTRGTSWPLTNTEPKCSRSCSR